MKKILYMMIAIAASLTVMTGCEEKDEAQRKIIGEWRCTTEEAGHDIEVYVSFNIDRTFDLYQKIGEGAHRHLDGSYEVDRRHLSGVYSDGTPWASDYTLTFVDGDMIMRSLQQEDYYITYKKMRIPDEVREFSVDLTRSSDDAIPVPFL